MRRLDRLVFVLVLVLFGAHATLYLDPFEDSYITYRYATNLATGNGLVYNPGERVEGFTSFAWTVLLAGLARVGVAPPVAAPALSLLLGSAFVALAAWIGLRVWAPHPAAGLRATGVAALVAAHGSLAYYAASGMETAAFLVALLLACGLALDERPSRANAQYLAGALLALAGALRPEGLGYAGLLVVALFASADTRKGSLGLATAFAVCFVPWFAWRAWYFGYPFPNTYYAKASPSLDRFSVGASHLETFVTLHGWWLVLVALAVVVRRRGLVPWVRVAIAMIAGTAVNVVFVGGDGFAFWRFLLPAVPWAMLLVVDAAALLVADGSAARRGTAVAAVALFGVLQLVGAWLPPRTLTTHAGLSAYARTRGVASINADYFEVGEFLARSVPSGTWIATNAAGIVPYVSRLPTIDMLGLNDAHIAHRAMPRWEGAIGHQKHDATYVIARAPQIILPGLPVLAKRMPRPEEIGPWFARWFPFLPGDRELLENAEFRRRYALEVAKVAEGKYLIFFRRVD